MRAPSQLRTILVATNGSEDDEGALDLGIALARGLDLELTVVRVRPPAGRLLRRLGVAEPVLHRHQDAWYDPGLAHARRHARERGVVAGLELVSGRRAEAVALAAKTFKADLLVAGHWARALAAKAPCAILLAPEAQAATGRGGVSSRKRGWGAPAAGAAATLHRRG